MNAYCINLKKRTDRWSDFNRNLLAIEDFPFFVERWEATDGHLFEPPSWWNGSHGAFGCYLSHVRLIEHAINTGLSFLCVFEDDCIFCENFAGRLEVLLASLPDNWEQVYLGGQHLTGDISQINEFVVQPLNVNRTHAYILRGTNTLVKIHNYLLSHRGSTQNGCHIDYMFGEMHEQGLLNVYAPFPPWLCGQAESQSDVNVNRPAKEYWWNQVNIKGQGN